MRAWSTIRPVLVAAVLAATLNAQDVGSFLPDAEWKGLSQSGAEEFGDFVGRLKVIEVFAYW